MERKDKYSIDENNFLWKEVVFMGLWSSFLLGSKRSVRLVPNIVFDRLLPEAMMNVVMYADRSKKSGSRTGPHLVVAIETSLQRRTTAENIPRTDDVVVTISKESSNPSGSTLVSSIILGFSFSFSDDIASAVQLFHLDWFKYKYEIFSVAILVFART